ncbi:hypothetical protein VTI28DRAFT_7101 [Corynascus sepedonium]
MIPSNAILATPLSRTTSPLQKQKKRMGLRDDLPNRRPQQPGCLEAAFLVRLNFGARGNLHGTRFCFRLRGLFSGALACIAHAFRWLCPAPSPRDSTFHRCVHATALLPLTWTPSVTIFFVTALPPPAWTPSVEGWYAFHLWLRAFPDRCWTLLPTAVWRGYISRSRQYFFSPSSKLRRESQFHIRPRLFRVFAAVVQSFRPGFNLFNYNEHRSARPSTFSTLSPPRHPSARPSPPRHSFTPIGLGVSKTTNPSHNDGDSRLPSMACVGALQLPRSTP